MNMILFLAEILIALVILEVCVMLLVKALRKRFQWLITPEDEAPVLDPAGLEKFINYSYDPELGWIRKPDTWHPEKGRGGQTSYHINDKGVRRHPGIEDLPLSIACFGDSFTFCRQVNDDETWPFYLSRISGKGVWNYGVGNYGIDQAYIRMRREFKKVAPEIVIMGVVPSTIVRILCVWKHYNEFGNTFAFKPRFKLVDGGLVLVKNIVDDEKKLAKYSDLLEDIRREDHFYLTKFRNEMLRFPYLYSVLRNPGRNIPLIFSLTAGMIARGMGIKNSSFEEYPMMKIMDINKQLRIDLFKDKAATDLLEAIIDDFAASVKEKGSVPVFLLMPQKDDVLHIKGKGAYYGDFMKSIGKKLVTIDLTDKLASSNDLDELYSDDNVYGGHFSGKGNKLVAETVYKALVKKGCVHNGQ